MKPALFLDRDGTLIEDVGYLDSAAKIRPLPGVPEALKAASAAGFLLFLVTNQSGIGRGYFSIEDAIDHCRATARLLGLGRDGFAGICIAPEKPEDVAVYRKPSPRFILESIHRHSLDPQRCWMVGDKVSDPEAGVAAGIQGVLLDAARHRETTDPNPGKCPFEVYPDLPSFVQGLKLSQSPARQVRPSHYRVSGFPD